MYVDKKILVSGIAMIVVGVSISLFLNATMPLGKSGMTEEQAFDLIQAQRESQDFSTLTGILSAVGFLLVLVSFGARRKRKGGGAKKIEKKPEQ